VFFVAVAVLATIMSAVQLVRWARDGEGAGEIRKRAWTVAVVLMFQTAFLVFIGVMFTTL
jgi:ABC-type amino acid transport system permease subunit